MTQYAGLAESWASDAALVYGPLARHLVAQSPVPLVGALALDAGAGSGVAGDALRAGGATVVAADREHDMAAYLASGGARPSVTADVTALPFRDGAFDVVTAAFVINHLPDPVAGLTELRRVTGRGGAVLASTFSVDRSAAKSAVDGVAVTYGFVRPGWYDELQVYIEAVGGAVEVENAVATAGFSSWAVNEAPVDVGLRRPADVVRYRLAMPHLHAFVETLDEETRSALVAEAATAVARTGERFAPVVVEAVAFA